ncbi:MAG: MltR family transcriptional regulator [Methylovirgula sp.]
MSDQHPKPKSLKQLQKETPSRDAVLGRVAQTQVEPDYEAALLSASLLEYMLMQAIRTKFISLGKDALESIFETEGGPISTFSAKIKIAYALGIMTAPTKSQIELIKSIRNHFAHHKDKCSFDEASIKSECAKLKQAKGLDQIPEPFKSQRKAGLTPKLKYTQACLWICVQLSMYVHIMETPGQISGPIDCI